MAEALDSSLPVATSNNPIVNGFNDLTILRQIGLMVGLAASIALGFGVILWSKEPNFRPLMTDLSHINAVQITDVLDSNQIRYKIDTNNGILYVDDRQVHKARLRLAGSGIPLTNDVGYEALDKESSFGTSQFMEGARYQRSLEGELGRTISSIQSVRSARVHLALPKQSVFVSKRRLSSASVLVDTHPGRVLDKTQVASIVHLVASSVPGLNSKSVTVVNQRGDLLSAVDDNSSIALAAKQLEYVRTLEATLGERVNSILEPILGLSHFKVELTADVDFTLSEKTAETFNPDLPAIRSEQSLTEERNGNVIGDVPGALTNQPPVDAQSPETTALDAGEAATVGNKRSQSTRNFELDRTISHTRYQQGTVKRITVAVVVDDVIDGTGATRAPLSDLQMERISGLVKDAIGYDMARGDRVNIVNSVFLVEKPEVIEEIAVEVWKQPWVFDIGKQVLGALFLMFLVFGLLRPILKSLAKKPVTETEMLAMEADGAGAVTPGEPMTALGSPSSAIMLPGPDENFEHNINAVKSVVAEDPRRVAQLVKSWLAD